MSDAIWKQLAAEEGKRFCSDWLTVDQAMIAEFADLTRDWYAIHVDPAAAAAAGYDGVVAHGFLTLSLLSPLYTSCNRPVVEGVRSGVNYGLESVRFLSPVIAGSSIRGHFEITSVARREPNQIREVMDVTVEIEGKQKPALAARWLTMYFL